MIRVNLLRTEIREIQPQAPQAPEFKERKKPVLGNIFILIFILILTVIIYSQQRTLSKEKSLLMAAEEEKKKLQNVLILLDQLEKQKSLFERKIQLINQLKSRQRVAVIIMEELSDTLPDWLWLTEANYKEGGIYLKGRALSNSSLAEYILNLEESPYFDNVDLISSTQRRQGNTQYFEFSLTTKFLSPSLPAQPEEGGEK